MEKKLIKEINNFRKNIGLEKINETIESHVNAYNLKSHLSGLGYKTQSNMDKRNGSVGMYDDSRAMYNSKLLENYILFLSICAISYFTMLQ